MLRSPKTKGSGLSFDHVSLAKKGPTLALDVPTGSTVAIMGPAASGKTALLEAIAGVSRVERGEIVRPETGFTLTSADWSRRESAMSTAREILGKNAAQKATDAISALGLWEVRQKPYLSLSPSQQAAAIFIPALLKEPKLLCSDHDFDHLDWPTLQNLWQVLADMRQRGLILAYTTHRPDLGEWADFVLILKNEQLVFSGTPESLKRTIAETTLEVATDNRPGAKAIADPFEVSIEETPDGLRMSTKEGQALAAKLLLEGYGDVKFLVQKPPTFAEAFSKLIG